MAGTLDDNSQFKPTISLFCEQAPSWVVMPTDTENLPHYYDASSSSAAREVENLPWPSSSAGGSDCLSCTSMCCIGDRDGKSQIRRGSANDRSGYRW